MIRLLFTSSPGAVSWLIRKLSGSPVSHVGVQVGEQAVVAVEVSGVVEWPIELFMRSRVIHSAYEAAPEVEEVLDVGHARSHVGAAYDFAGLPGFAWVNLVRRWFGMKVRNPLASANGMVCSEFVLHLDHGGRVPEFRGLDPEGTSPGDLLRRLQAGGPSFRHVDLGSAA